MFTDSGFYCFGFLLSLFFDTLVLFACDVVFCFLCFYCFGLVLSLFFDILVFFACDVVYCLDFRKVYFLILSCLHQIPDHYHLLMT